MAKRLNIRWIGIDRPGFGFSTFLPGRTALGWVDDLRHLIRHLGLRKYRVLGASGGTPYALACAKLLPKDEILSVGVAFGIAPWEAGSKGLSIYNRLGMFIWGHFPNIMAKALDKELVTLVHQHDIEPTLQLTRKFARNTTKKDRELLEQDDQIQGFASIWREVFRQGSSQAWVADSKIATEQWGFELENVGYEGVRLWYGKEDVNTPPNAGRYMADRLPGAVYKEYEGRSHFTMWENIEEILTDMRRDV
jgi:pimeloyl-ACP methyl ester carboxylesterase